MQRPKQPVPFRLADAAFTLIEMLVVIAIMGVLSALLLPALTATRDKARQIADLNNLDQIGKAIGMYVSDYGDRIPDARTMWPSKLTLYPHLNGAIAAKGPMFAQYLYVDGGEGHDPREFHEPDDGQANHAQSLQYLLKPYLHDDKVWVNPNARVGVDEAGLTTRDPAKMVQSYVAYGNNFALKAYGRTGVPAPPGWPPYPGADWAMADFFAEQFNNLDGRPVKLRQRESDMAFWVRNSIEVRGEPVFEDMSHSWHEFRMPHMRGSGKTPGFHVLTNEMGVRFIESHNSKTSSPW